MVKLLQARYGFLGIFTMPKCQPALDTFTALCGGDNPRSGFIYDLMQKFINYDAEECAYANSLNFEQEIDDENDRIQTATNLLEGYVTLGTKSQTESTKKVTNKETEKKLSEVEQQRQEQFEIKRELQMEKKEAHQQLIQDCRLYLDKLGWKSIDDEGINDLVLVLEKYKITSKEQICAFLAECSYESQLGEKCFEDGDSKYFESHGYETKYRGAGYIHLTFDYGYKCFATYLILQKYPKLRKYGEFINPAKSKDFELMAERYSDIVTGAEELKIDISEYTAIVDVGADYVGEKFAWESAGYFWFIKGCNDKAHKGMDIDEISRLVLGSDNGSYKIRRQYFEKIYGNIE